MAKRSKKYLEVLKMIDKKKQYSIQEAAELVSKLVYTKFVPSIEIAIKTFADPKYNDQAIRATTSLPHGNGKSVRVAAFVPENQKEELLKAGADVVGSDDLLAAIEKWDIDFDILVTTPDQMRNLAKIAKILGPKWIMPNPKAGTVAVDLAAAVAEIKKGRFEFKLDKTGNIHAIVGKANFSATQLAENIQAFIVAVNAHKPSWIKGKLIKKVAIAPSIGPSIIIAS